MGKKQENVKKDTERNQEKKKSKKEGKERRKKERKSKRKSKKSKNEGTRDEVNSITKSTKTKKNVEECNTVKDKEIIENFKKVKANVNRQELDVHDVIGSKYYGFTAEQYEELKEAFNLFDKDKSGVLSKDELSMVIDALGGKPDDNELDKMMKEMDTDGNGVIDLIEFVQAMSKVDMLIKDDEARLKQAFQLFDKDGDGTVSVKEFRYAMTHMGDRLTNEDVDDMIACVDANGDGEITWEELLRLFTIEEELGKET